MDFWKNWVLFIQYIWYLPIEVFLFDYIYVYERWDIMWIHFMVNLHFLTYICLFLQSMYSEDFSVYQEFEDMSVICLYHSDECPLPSAEQDPFYL